jgi:structural maintenance of chromosome 2
MHLKEIVLDGFKSYAHRTVVSGFDTQFNAITGFNGTGKSNILDSICFVLGISNLSQVRAASLQELVYKQGQAGITKATVTLTFDNADKSSSPVGYESFDEITITRQIAIGGRNKYLINGKVAQLSMVQNLFHSVQLNINNPNFLIMQGRITKVINMKPPEILSMIEETAGTRMYQSKKESALKTIEKKDAKVQEIERILKEEITPSLERLRKERSQYMQWSAKTSEAEKLSRLVIAYRYTRARQKTTRAEEEAAEMQNQMKECNSQSKAMLEESEQKRRIAETIAAEKKGNSELKKMEDNVAAHGKQLVKLSTRLKTLQQDLADEEKTILKHQKEFKKIKDSLESKCAAAAQADGISLAAAQDLKLVTDTLEALQQAMISGTSGSGGGEARSLADQIMDARKAVADATSEVKRQRSAAKHLESEALNKRKAMEASKKEYEAVQKELAQAQHNANQLKSSIQSYGFDASSSANDEAREIELKSTVKKLSQVVDDTSAELSSVRLDYQDPEPGFDRSRVKGLVAQLVEIKDEKYATALEVTAGGRLYNVVVDNEETGTGLLQKGGLKKRITIIPLNKVQSGSLSKDQVTASNKLAPGKTSPAIQLLSYDDDVQAAISFVFGKTIICEDSESAKKVAFDPAVRTKAVTLEGDIFDPSGTLTGGSRASTGSSVLIKLKKLGDSRAQLEAAHKELQALQARRKSQAEAAAQHSAMVKDLKVQERAVELAQKRLERTDYGVAEKEAAEAHSKAIEAMAAAERAEAAVKDHTSLAEQLEAAAAKGTDEATRRKELEKKVSAARDKVSTTKKAAVTAENAAMAAREESASLQKELDTLESTIASCQQGIADATQAVRAAESEVASAKQEFDDAEAELQTKKDAIKARDLEGRELRQEAAALEEKAQAAKAQAKKLAASLDRHDKDVKLADKEAKALVQEHSWIETERHLFGKAKGDYDFAARDIASAEAEYDKLQEDLAQQGRHINKKVLSMFDKAEMEYQDLLRRKMIVQNDKAKIEAVIAELDDKKNAALKTTWTKVNRDFGSIFSTLLPGARAKLEPPEGGDLLDGLELKVAFGAVWKDSLSELSGGQKSLLALSLILALLLFKPAPMSAHVLFKA